MSAPIIPAGCDVLPFGMVPAPRANSDAEVWRSTVADRVIIVVSQMVFLLALADIGCPKNADRQTAAKSGSVPVIARKSAITGTEQPIGGRSVRTVSRGAPERHHHRRSPRRSGRRRTPFDQLEWPSRLPARITDTGPSSEMTMRVAWGSS